MKNPVLSIVLICICLFCNSCTSIPVPVWPFSHYYVKIAPNLYEYKDGDDYLDVMIYQKSKKIDTFPETWELCWWGYPEVPLEVGNGYEEGYEYILKVKKRSQMFPSDDNPDNPYHDEVSDVELVSKTKVDYVVHDDQIVSYL